MHAEFSEFTYGFALTTELVDRGGLRWAGAPLFPSLRQEATKGYDVALPGVPVFLQFKLSEYMVRPSAKEWAQLRSAPYYRMQLRPSRRSNQHALLVDLESRGNVVLYATPEFQEMSALNASFSRCQVVASSALWSPRAIGYLPDDRDHCVAFSPGAASGWFRSEPREVSRVAALDQLNAPAEARPLGPAFFRELSATLRAVAAQNGLTAPDLTAHTPDIAPEQEATLLAMILFECSLLIRQ